MGSMYAYTGRSSQGRFVAGTLRAENRDQALAHLRMRSLFVTSLGEAGSTRGVAGTLATLRPLSESARTTFFRSFAAMIGAGVPIRRALHVCVENCTDQRLHEALSAISNDIESGSALSHAMSKRPREFSGLFVAMIRAGELGGALDQILERLAALLERHQAIRKRVRAAMTYPAVVAAASLVLVLFLVGTTVPSFEAIFAEMHVALPPITRGVIAVGNVLRNPEAWPFLALIPGIWIATSFLARRVPAIQDRLDRLAFKIPVLGKVITRSIAARFSRTLGTLLRCGVPLLDAIDAARDVMENARYQHRLNDISEALRGGTSFADALERTSLYEGLFVQLVRVGEETGTLDSMLLRLADYYDLDIETSMSTLGSAIEPVLILVLGSVVGLIVASILIPLYSMIGSVK